MGEGRAEVAGPAHLVTGDGAEALAVLVEGAADLEVEDSAVGAGVVSVVAVRRGAGKKPCSSGA